MLTEWASRERQWGSFPALRKVLEGKPVPSECIISTDETPGEEISRLLHTWRLVHQYERQITELAKAGDRNQVVEDLRRLEGHLRAASRHVEDAAKEIGAIRAALATSPSEYSEGTY